jgi:hypothetical protein
MKHGSFRVVWLLVLAVALAMISAPAYAQGAATSASLSGQVHDSSGAVIPGAEVVVKHAATGAEARTVTDATGKFTIPALPPGTYVVTVSLMGFKTVSLPDIQVLSATPTNIRAIVLEVGRLEETVVVTGATEIVQTQTAAVTTTLSTAQINTAPLPTRNTMDFVAMLPGVNTTSTIRGSTVMGLSGNATNITIDGINVQDNFLKSTDGFFARINPRMDAVEEVTVSTANPGAESAGQGAVQIRFQTRQGTNKFQGSVYWFNRNTAYNTNYWFNIRDGLQRDRQNINTAGFRVGGPIVIPKLFDGHDKLFFFFNYEDWEPGTSTTPRTRSVMTDNTLNGLLYYGKVDAAHPLGTYSVDLWKAISDANATLAGTKDASGKTWVPLPTQADPAMMKVLNAIQASRANGNILTGTLAGFNTLTWSAPASQYRKYPTLRVDYNITPRNRVGLSYYFQKYASQPDTLNTYDPYYPGFPNGLGQNSNRWNWVANYRSTITSNMVNEVRGGMTGGPVLFADGNGKQYFDDPQIPMNGWAVNLGLITNTYRTTADNSRDAPTRMLEDSLSWIKGRHSISIGATFTQVLLNWPYNYYANTLNLGIATGDEMQNLFASSKPTINGVVFSAATMPNATSTEIGYANSLYAMLTGRAQSVAYTAYLGPDGQYHVPPTAAIQKAHQNELGTYFQDSWRLRPNLTLNYGLRWEVQRPFAADSPYYWKLQDPNMVYGSSGVPTSDTTPFTPGVLNGTLPVLVPLTGAAYNQDWRNFAPSAGIAWKPQVSSAWLKKILSADPVFRGGFSRAYLRNGMAAFTNEYSYNPGGSLDASRNTTLGNITPGTVFFGQPSSIPGPATYSATPAASVTPLYTNDILTFLPNTKTPYTNSWNIGWQRTLGKNTAMEIRYVGNRARNQWYGGNGRNLNGEPDILHNPGGAFYNEFKTAQANLLANIAAGRGSTFKYAGAGTGTAPLPVFMAFFEGKTLNSGAANDAANYKSTNWGSSTYYNNMGLQNPSATGVASSLQSNAGTRTNGFTNAGLAANFFYMVPEVAGAGAWVIGREADYRNSSYDSVQIELRRRMSNGLLVQGSYQRVFENNSTGFYSLFQSSEETPTGVPLDTLKVNWVYELPFGQGKRFGGGVSRGWNRLIGGWSFDGTGRIQSGNRLDFGNYRLVNMTDQDLQDMFQIRFVNDSQGKTRVYYLPQDVIDNTILAFSNTATSLTGYSGAAPTGRYLARNNGPACIPSYSGDTCGAPRHHYVWGPRFVRFDFSLRKRIDVTARIYTELGLDAMNVFNAVNFFGTTGVGNTLGSFELATSGAYRDSSGTNDPGGRLLQLSWRVSW